MSEPTRRLVVAISTFRVSPSLTLEGADNLNVDTGGAGVG